MKINYELIRNILEVMEEHKNHEILGKELLDKLNIKVPEDDNNEEEILLYDNLVGHIKILFDNECIDNDFNNKENKYGFTYLLSTNFPLINGAYRITAKGYDFLSGLREDKVFSKIKDFSINVAIETAKQLLVKLALGNL
ncbi:MULTISPECIES: DUF2513 domain-containing protein [Brachyspira]|nr:MULTISPECIES: DUF2513 domain-containing protein [Brachyspira]